MKLDSRLLALLNSHRLLFVLVVLAGFLGGIFIVLQARTISLVISSVFLYEAHLEDVKQLLIFLLILIILRGLSIFGGEMAGRHLAGKIKLSLREDLSKHIYQLGPGYSRRGGESGSSRSGELVQIMNQGVEALDTYFSQYIPQLVLAVLVPLTILIFVIPVDRLSALVLILTAPLIPLFMVLIGDRADSLTKHQWSALKWMSVHFLDVLQGLSTLKVFSRSKDQIEIIARIGERYRHTTMSVLRVAFLSALVLEWVAMLSTAVVAVEIGLRLLYGRLEFEQAFFILLLTPEFYLPLRLLGTRFHAGMAGMAAAASIFDLLETQPDQAISRIQRPLQLINSGDRRLDKISIEFQHVHFGYSDSENILQDISFVLPAGKMTALVGPSGAGKSTIADLLLRFVHPLQGEIFVNRIPMLANPDDWYLAHVSWVPQNPYLFNTSVAENIRLSNPDACLEEVMTAARKANAHEFIERLPQGYHTQIGERGAFLSAGQVQRLALARAFLKQSPMLILDEATANLDPDSIAKIGSATSSLMEGRTALVIAHQLTTIQQADQIIYLDHGRILERGTHAELMDLGGAYWRMVNDGQGGKPNEDGFVSLSGEFNIGLSPDIASSRPTIHKLPFSSVCALVRQLANYKWLVLLSILLGWATVISGMGLLATAAYLISAAAIVPSIAFLQVPIVGVRFFGLARGIFRYLERNTSHNITLHLVANLRVWFYQQLEPLAPARLMQHRSGELLNRIHNDLNSLEDFYVRVISPPLVWLGVTLKATIILGIFSFRLGVILLGFQFLAGLIMPILVRYASRERERELLKRRGNLTAELVDGIQGMPELKVFDSVKSQLISLKKINQKIGKVQNQLGSISSIETATGNILAHLASWTVLLAAIPMVTGGQIEGVFLGTLVLITLASFESTLPLPLSARSLESSLAAAGRLDQVLAAKPEIIDSEDPIPAPAEYDLEIENLSFSYPTSTADPSPSLVLDQINLSLEPGHRYAIVGPSGSGKSTLANILLRFWGYQDGRIRLGGHELSSYRQADIRALISFVSQRPHIFNASIRENLLLGNPHANQEEILRACQTAQIDDFIETLPHKFDSQLGEGGLRLSAGERQRVAIARALLKNTPIAIFDEPTANLDSNTERDLVQALFTALNKKTMLWITHRLVGMHHVDEIFVMAGGEIIERGRHPDLITLEGAYKRMWDLQNQVI